MSFNAALHLDLLVIGEKRMYMGEGIPFDPEGILSTLTSIVNVIAGYLAGRFIQKNGNSVPAIRFLFVAGILLIGLSYAWDLGFPINKKIWTSPYVLLTVGWDLVLLSFLIFVIEVAQFSKWTYFFQAFGRNPLILYVCSGLVIALISFIPIGDSNLQDSFLLSPVCTGGLRVDLHVVDELDNIFSNRRQLELFGFTVYLIRDKSSGALRIII